MLQRLDSATARFLNDLAEIGRRLFVAQRNLASGRRIHTASDAPDEVSSLLQVRAELAHIVQIQANLGRVRAEVGTAEQALQAAVGVLERAAVLGTQGANGTQTAEQRRMIALEVESLLQQMVGLAGTTVEGRYVFSGDADSQPTFTLDLTLSDPVSAYLGAPATRQIMHPSGRTFAVSRTGEEIFDNPDPSRNLFGAINHLRLALGANDEDAIVAALGEVRSAQTHLNSQLAFYGTVQNQVAEATEFAYRQEVRLKTRLSEIEDTDMTEAVVALNQERQQQEVALAAKAKLSPLSLFDFLG